jgi:hypothetical protein
MFDFSIFMLSILIVILLSIAFLILKTLKKYSKEKIIDNRTETILISIIILAGIIFFPWFFTRPYFSVYNLGETGQIGDTIGGITSPFINEIGAILIYIAFKEQVNSSKSAREEKRIDLIIENLNRPENDPYTINALCNNCLADLTNRINNSDNILKLTRVMREFQSLSKFINSLTEDKDFVENKFYLTWKLHYEPTILTVNQHIVSTAMGLGIQFLIGTPITFNSTFLDIKKTAENYE